MIAVVLAIDAGTTGVRTLAFDEQGMLVDSAYRELTQYYPQPGWVEHDAAEIWAHVSTTLHEVATRQRDAGRSIAAIGLTNQRETLVTWHSSTGTPARRAIVWQDRRSAGICDRLRDSGHEDQVRARTGLVLDPYFTATKMAWVLGKPGSRAPGGTEPLAPGGTEPLEITPDLVMATVDTWIVWNLTGGVNGGVLVTDATNASRTLLYDIGERRWSAEMADVFGVPLSVLPDVVPSCATVGTVTGDLARAGGPLAGVAVSGIAGDQHAALFGQACFRRGMAKVTNGTGSFVLLTQGTAMPTPLDGVLTTVAWDLGDKGGNEPFMYALEGAVFVTGAAVQWLRDGLGIISDSAEVDALASAVPGTEGVFVVPAFTGLGSPWWDPYARGAIVGLTRGVGRAHIARAVIESMAFQVRDVIDAMTSSPTGIEKGDAPRLEALRVDGGASVSDLLLQLQADQLQAPVQRPSTTETTALGAATLAGLAVGVWSSLEELSDLWHLEAEFQPKSTPGGANMLHGAWLKAVERSRHWA